MNRRLGTSLCGVLLSVFLANACLAQDSSNPKTDLFITYKCKASDRAALRRYMEGPGVNQIEKWRGERVFSDYLVLFSSFVNESTWDMMLRLTFDKLTDTARWAAIEREFPGGLSREALQWAQPLNSYLADLTWSGKSPKAQSDRSKAVYLLIEYRYARYGSKEKYKEYVEGYTKNTMEAWLQDGHMSSYGIYLNHDTTGRPWGSLILLEYTDLAGFAKREIAKQKAKLSLSQANPTYSLLNDTAEYYRDEGPVMVADAIVVK